MQDKVWVTKRRERILVANMETRHIHNCIRMIQRSIARGLPWRVDYYDRLQLELEIRRIQNR